jgi:hypothetical protein
MGEWKYNSTFLYLVSFTVRPLYSRGKSLQYTLNRKLGGPQSRSGPCGEEREIFTRKRTQAAQPLARHYIYRDVQIHEDYNIWNYILAAVLKGVKLGL